MKTIKKVFIILSIISAFLLVFFVRDYINKDKLYKDYKRRVDFIINCSKEQIVLNTGLMKQITAYEIEKEDLQKKIDDKKTQIVEKEKIIYVQGKLTVPEDYETIKTNYFILSDLYKVQINIREFLENKDKISAKEIVDLTKALDDTTVKLKTATDLLQNKIDKPVPFIEHVFLLGVGRNENGMVYSGAYLLTLKNKIYIEGVVSLPLQMQVLLGVKL